MPNDNDHDKVIVSVEKINSIQKSLDRIENKFDSWPVICSAKHTEVDSKITEVERQIYKRIFKVGGLVVSGIAILIAGIKWAVPVVLAALL